MQAPLGTVEIEPETSATGSVIWLHGLGADGHDFVPVIEEMRLPRALPLRFVLPHAPLRAVTLNAGQVMPAWYDLTALDEAAADDIDGLQQAAGWIAALIAREAERGVRSERVVIAGFSQGGALALYTALRYPRRLAGLIGLSTYLPAHQRLPDEASRVNRDMPVLMAHGRDDDLVRMEWGHRSCEILQQAGYSVQWQEYDMPHAVCPEEIVDIRRCLLAWLG